MTREIECSPFELPPDQLVICQKAPSFVTAIDAIEVYRAKKVQLPIAYGSYLSDLRGGQLKHIDNRLYDDRRYPYDPPDNYFRLNPYHLDANMGLIGVINGRVPDKNYRLKNWYRLAGDIGKNVVLHDLSLAGAHHYAKLVYPLSLTFGRQQAYIKNGDLYIDWGEGLLYCERIHSRIELKEELFDLPKIDKSFVRIEKDLDGYFHAMENL